MSRRANLPGYFAQRTQLVHALSRLVDALSEESQVRRCVERDWHLRRVLADVHALVADVAAVQAEIEWAVMEAGEGEGDGGEEGEGEEFFDAV